MGPLSSLQSEESIYLRLVAASQTTWGSERTIELEHTLRSASRQIRLLFQVTLDGRDVEPDFIDDHPADEE